MSAAAACSPRPNGTPPPPPPRLVSVGSASSSSAESVRMNKAVPPPPPPTPPPRHVNKPKSEFLSPKSPKMSPRSPVSVQAAAPRRGSDHQKPKYPPPPLVCKGNVRQPPPPPPPPQRIRESRPLRQRQDSLPSRTPGKPPGSPSRGRPSAPRPRSNKSSSMHPPQDAPKVHHQASGASRRSRTASHGKRRSDAPPRAKSTPSRRAVGLEPEERREPVVEACERSQHTRETDKSDHTKKQATPEQIEQYKQLYDAMMQEAEKGDAKWTGLGDDDDDDDDDGNGTKGKDAPEPQAEEKVLYRIPPPRTKKGGDRNGSRRAADGSVSSSAKRHLRRSEARKDHAADARKARSRGRSSGSHKSRDRSRGSGARGGGRDDRDGSLSAGRRLTSEGGALVLSAPTKRGKSGERSGGAGRDAGSSHGTKGEEDGDPGGEAVRRKGERRSEALAIVRRSRDRSIPRSSGGGRGGSCERETHSIGPSSKGTRSETGAEARGEHAPGADASGAKPRRGWLGRIRELVEKARTTLGEVALGGGSSGVHKFKVGDRAHYRIYRIPESLVGYVDLDTGTVEVEIVAVHVDAVLEETYYTIELPDGNQKQTNWLKLTPLSWRNRHAPRGASNKDKEHRRRRSSPPPVIRSRSPSGDGRRERSRSNGSRRRSRSRGHDEESKSAASAYSTTAQRARRPRSSSPGQPPPPPPPRERSRSRSSLRNSTGTEQSTDSGASSHSGGQRHHSSFPSLTNNKGRRNVRSEEFKRLSCEF